jgi:hypothetical protein
MILTHEQLKAIVLAGGALVLDASTMTFDQMRDIAAAASSAHTQLAVKNLSGMTPGQLKALATIAPGLISFDMTS